ncbi:hypothetical protein DJ031_08060 [bacterium endosymbiont of Escarpia laminata]|nr:MAG: hypothetical protein DJ031_08060 [bacterium endosymbiont of Escarpia laminata]
MSACGGGGEGDGGTTTTAGRFIDSPVEGLTYVSGAQSGTTGGKGQFTCEDGGTVTFFLGPIVLGTVACQDLVMPTDLTSSENEAINFARFLQTLDDDGDPDNGINIPEVVRQFAENSSAWPKTLNFADTDFENNQDIINIISDLSSITGGPVTLVTAAVAELHLVRSLRCHYSGAFMGNYSGDESGRGGFLIDASSGNLIGGYSSTSDLTSEGVLTGHQFGDVALGLDYGVTGITDTSVTFSGRFSSRETISGTWGVPGFSGSWSGNRIGYSATAVERYTGFSPDVSAIFTFDIDASGNITGRAFSFEDGSLNNVIGTKNVANNTISGTLDDGTTFEGTLSGWQVTGTATQGVDTAAFFGSGCAL